MMVKVEGPKGPGRVPSSESKTLSSLRSISRELGKEYAKRIGDLKGGKVQMNAGIHKRWGGNHIILGHIGPEGEPRLNGELAKEVMNSLQKEGLFGSYKVAHEGDSSVVFSITLK